MVLAGFGFWTGFISDFVSGTGAAYSGSLTLTDAAVAFGSGGCGGGKGSDAGSAPGKCGGKAKVKAAAPDSPGPEPGDRLGAAVLMVVTRGDVRSFQPNIAACPSFAKHLEKAKADGVTILAHGVKWGEGEQEGKGSTAEHFRLCSGRCDFSPPPFTGEAI